MGNEIVSQGTRDQLAKDTISCVIHKSGEAGATGFVLNLSLLTL